MAPFDAADQLDVFDEILARSQQNSGGPDGFIAGYNTLASSIRFGNSELDTAAAAAGISSVAFATHLSVERMNELNLSGYPLPDSAELCVRDPAHGQCSENTAVCLDDDVDISTCLCLPGFFGLTCESCE